MCEFAITLAACIIITLVMILIVEIQIRRRKRWIMEWEAMYAPEDKERNQGGHEG